MKSEIEEIRSLLTIHIHCQDFYIFLFFYHIFYLKKII